MTAPGMERHTHVDNSALADMSATEIPDLDHYAKCGWLPKVPESLAEVVADHQRISASYRHAKDEQARWEAIGVNAEIRGTTTAIAAAIEKGEDPVEAEAQARQAITDARDKAASAKAIVAAHRNPILASSYDLMTEVANWTEADEHLTKQITKLSDVVTKASAALTMAKLTLSEATQLKHWLDGTYPGIGRDFPQTSGLQTTNLDPNPDDDPENLA
jgi:hypothetical protein